MNYKLRSLIEKFDVRKEMHHDFEKMSKSLEKHHVNLSSKSLKRLWGYLSGKEKPRQETLDRIALFAGFQKWEDLIAALHGDSDARMNY